MNGISERDNRMPFKKNWSQWWRRFLDFAPDASLEALDILRQRYVEEVQQAGRFKQYAQRMHYPQYQGKLLQLAADTSKHAQWIAAKIGALGGGLPKVPERRSTNENSWKSLLMAIEDENRSADHLPEQLRRIGLDYPDITKLLQEVSYEQKKHRDAIREMLMRSDPFALSLA
jgi:rubrerythrin